MRKTIWCGMLGAMMCAAISYLAVGSMNRHSRPAGGEDPRLMAEVPAYAPALLHLADALLPDPAKLLEDWQAFETIDLLNAKGGSNVAELEDAGQQPAFGLVFKDFLPQDLVPADIIRSADEAECFPLMPSSEKITPLALMLKPDRAEAGEDDEEQDELTEPPADSKAIEERLRRILQSYLRDGKLPGVVDVDTMEFRPSDAKKGEFDRIPF